MSDMRTKPLIDLYPDDFASLEDDVRELLIAVRKHMPEGRGLSTVPQFAHATGIPSSTLYRLVKQGVLPSVVRPRLTA